MSTYWHGGRRPHNAPHLGVERLLLPQEAARCGGDGDGWVYITTNRDLAATYASTLPGSWLMQVEPLGSVETDPGSMLPYSFRCRSARILRSYRISNAERATRARAVLNPIKEARR